MKGRLWSLSLPDQPVRGAFISLGDDWAELVASRAYSADQAGLLGQVMVAMPLLATHLKNPARMSLQISQAGEVKLLTAQAGTDGALRGLIKSDAPSFDLGALSGQLVVTLEPENSNEKYQGIVALDGDDPAAWLRRYFHQSEQVETRLILCADEHGAQGLMLQAVPGQGEAEGVDWQAAMDAMAVDMLPDEPGEWLSVMLGMDLRVSEQPQTVRIHCPCNESSVSRMLVGLGQDEVRSIVEEQGSVSVECGFCGQEYRFDAARADALFTPPSDDAAVH